MADLKLSFACWDYDRTRPLMDGRVKPEGIELDIHILRPRETFQRMLDNKEFQASEMSLASYTALKGRGEVPVRRSAGSAVANISPFLHLRAPGRRDCGTAGPARQARRHLAMERNCARLHAWHVAGRLWSEIRGHALVHGRPQQLRRAASDRSRSPEPVQA